MDGLNTEPRYHFGPCHRLKRRSWIKQLFQSGKSYYVDRFRFVYSKLPDIDATDCSQILIAVSRKVGKSPERNRIKRLFREQFRLRKSTFPDGLMMAFVLSKPTDKKIDSQLVRFVIEQCAARLNQNRSQKVT